MITINKLDRAFLELQLPSDDMYTAFVKHVENVNVLVSTYHDEALGDVQVDPTKGTVAFSAGLHGWAFTLTKFARMYAKKVSHSQPPTRTLSLTLTKKPRRYRTPSFQP